MIATDHDMMIGRVGLPSAAMQRGWRVLPRPPESLAEFRAEANMYLEAGNKGAKDELEKWDDMVKGRAPCGGTRDMCGTRDQKRHGDESSNSDVGTQHV